MLPTPVPLEVEALHKLEHLITSPEIERLRTEVQVLERKLADCGPGKQSHLLQSEIKEVQAKLQMAQLSLMSVQKKAELQEQNARVAKLKPPRV